MEQLQRRIDVPRFGHFIKLQKHHPVGIVVDEFPTQTVREYFRAFPRFVLKHRVSRE
jgi:hypothetical protein